ncbi:MAG: Hpt domain-containing protein [Cellvibrionaceae bacterium]|nr:Hpt domain-containing protein [Cellvibrionaceae bacterium]
MADNRQYAALEWVIKGIRDTLLDAQRVLDLYGETPEDLTQLRFCITHIHQVYGSLHMINFHGAAMLAEEMEALAKALLDNRVHTIAEGKEVLSRSIDELPSYLARVQKSKRDYPAMVLSLLNDMRAVRGASLLSESTLFTPNLECAYRPDGTAHAIIQNNEKLLAILQKLLQMYQYAAAGVLKQTAVDQNLCYLAKVSDRLQKLLQGTQRYAVWEIAHAVIDGMQHQFITQTAALRRILGDLNQELKQLSLEGNTALNKPTAEALIKNLLYYVGLSKQDTPLIEAIKKRYGLDQLMPLNHVIDEQQINPIDSATLQTVALDIRQEFTTIKARLHDCIQGNDAYENASLAQQRLQKIIDTLAILGVGKLRQKLSQVIIAIAALRRREHPLDQTQLLDIVQTVIDIESKLDNTLVASDKSLAAHHDVAPIPEAELDACRNGLEQAKDAIVDYIALKWDADKLAPVPDMLRDVRLRFTHLSLDRAAAILSACIVYVESELIAKTITPKWPQLDSLADVIASVDYYLEFLSTAQERDETILERAEDALASLDVKLAPAASVAQLSTAATADSSSGQTTDLNDTADELVDDEVIEIFIEEAGEIVEKIDSFLPQWQANHADHTALIEIRRSFHTLKGSGRMVKATAIGELGWAVENMLNRILDNSLSTAAIHLDLIARVRAIIPDMVSAFSDRTPNPHKQLAQDYMTWAHELSEGRQPAGGLAAEAAIDKRAFDESDYQLWQIFKAEAEMHLQVVNAFVDKMQAARPFYEPPSDSLQQALHTLKGSAYMAELNPIADIMAPMEKFAKELRSYQVNIDDDIFQLIKDCVDYTRQALAQIGDCIFPVIAKADQFLARVDELRERTVGPLVRQQEELAQKTVDPAILELLMAEGMNLLLNADLMIDEWQQNTTANATNDWQALCDELDKVREAALLANLPSLATLCQQLLQNYQQLIDGKRVADTETYALLLQGHEGLMDICDAIAAGQDLPQENHALLKRLSATASADAETTAPATDTDKNTDTSTDPSPDRDAPDTLTETLADDAAAEEDELDPETVDIFFDEANELLDELDADINAWEEGGEAKLHNEAMQRTLHTFKGGARLAGLMALGDLAHDFESFLVDSAKDPALVDIFKHIHSFQDRLLQGTEQVGHSLGYATQNPATTEGSVDDSTLGATPDREATATQGTESETTVSEQTAAENHPVAPSTTYNATDSATDAETPTPTETATPVQTAPTIAQAEAPSTADTQSDLTDTSPTAPADAEDTSPSPETSETATAPRPATKPSPATAPNSATAKVLRFPEGVGSAVPQPQTAANAGSAQAAARRNQPQEVVKVASELMESLVNLAGETSISRGRVEEQVSELGFSLDEMGSTVQRLQEQLRRLDIETEAQILFRQEQMFEQNEFDPLEMDRYSQLQQLSRSLIESASDLFDLQSTISDKTRDVETVLLEQSRINTDLQEGLMRSRMVPFSRIVPRLRRIVRQIATELNKDVNLQFGNIEGELDKSMMEHMVAPLEHMLRNAIDHGIEDEEARAAAGKSAEGSVLIGLEREGGDVLITVSDDGRGIDVAKVKAKAIERHLLQPDAELSDQEILQFILYAGFSTAETVTQISGRGVGMDVVNSEIKLMGGSIAIDSRLGEGTAFTIRVPFTVSVNRALMISMGEDRYAVPLNTIEGIVRVSPYELEHYYANPDQAFNYAGRDYELRYLGTLLDNHVAPRLQGHSLPLPVLLLRSNEHSVAIHVDSLLGSREITVKGLGTQFKSVQGVSGATILGDGHVVIILDPNSLVRRVIALNTPQIIATQQTPQLPEATKTPLAMVVDDSVTVRKVTTRLLEREGYDVIAAKDGVDAMTLLQTTLPDIMLLDIEMPRMDGFEVAKNVRSNSQLQHLPIIMITSRTSDKHRQRGLECGANIYMGKPYQESQLLDNIRELITVTES